MLFIWKKRRFFQKWEAPFFFASFDAQSKRNRQLQPLCNRTTAIASKLAPTLGRSEHRTHEHPRSPVVAKLARDEASKPNIHVTEPPPSRASFAPTDVMGV